MTLINFINYLYRLFDGEALTNEELNLMDNKALELLNQMKENTIDENSQNALDEYVDLFERKQNRELANKIIDDYYKVINEKALAKPNGAGRGHSGGPVSENGNKVLVYTNMSGMINTVAIIEVVLIIGVLAAFIVLALIH